MGNPHRCDAGSAGPPNSSVVTGSLQLIEHAWYLGLYQRVDKRLEPLVPRGAAWEGEAVQLSPRPPPGANLCLDAEVGAQALNERHVLLQREALGCQSARRAIRPLGAVIQIPNCQRDWVHQQIPYVAWHHLPEAQLPPHVPLGAVWEELIHVHCVEQVLARPSRLKGRLGPGAEWAPQHLVLPVHVLSLCHAVADAEPAALGRCRRLLYVEVP